MRLLLLLRNCVPVPCSDVMDALPAATAALAAGGVACLQDDFGLSSLRPVNEVVTHLSRQRSTHKMVKCRHYVEPLQPSLAHSQYILT